jgi:hypothetical protein
MTNLKKLSVEKQQLSVKSKKSLSVISLLVEGWAFEYPLKHFILKTKALVSFMFKIDLLTKFIGTKYIAFLT